ncbi:hypothetical protein SDRG_14536 [Saprolegnia diclina VS20]|uniref:Protein kinase domain-containing protein n=1 Tax=Saprolegnia diclina (strain VS20) TaxID=1156394 RepID=T0R6K6_SAPDV|nr:hypothetical protein SDRG_14536 [Saprolegnia diclina VS20]EQC27698.1 hypothetical protein SDRG_14536 [Saprolegnia diclina VS20]|eukprot:XP_008618893.1 hypothetical protein SDRG_14536 [Saprolegnia diclina VS20]
MAPEMHMPHGYSAAKVDVWSLGILLWMLLTGVPLVEASNDDDEAFGYLKRCGIPLYKFVSAERVLLG